MKAALDFALKKPWVVPTIVGAAAFGCGAGIGFLVATKRRQPEPDILYIQKDPQMTMFDSYGEPKEEAVSSSATHTHTKWDTLDNPHVYKPEPLVEDYEELVNGDDEAHEVVLTVDDEPVVTHNVFDDTDPNWSWKDELEHRKSKDIYVIHLSEFNSNESEYDQETVTYYQKDDILADQSDVPIYNYGTLMGDLKFGHGSQDEEVVNIRNDKIQMEWEVVFHPGAFEAEVLGFDVEEQYEAQDLKHSNYLKFRQE